MPHNRPGTEKSYRARVSHRRKRYLVAGVILFASALVASIPLWLPHAPQVNPLTPTQEIDIAHALTNRNDTRVGTPQSGYVFIDFNMTIMNCGYSSFQIGPSLFDVVIDGVRYHAALDATSRLRDPLPPKTLGSETEVFGGISYEIPASQVPDIPLTPLVYTGGTFNIQWRSNW